MKRLMILAMVAGLIFSCAELQMAKDFVCNPTPAQQQDAALALAALDALQAAGSIFVPELGIVQASAVFTVIKNGGCFFLNELATALAALDAARTKAAVTKGFKAPVKFTDFPSLRNAIKK